MGKKDEHFSIGYLRLPDIRNEQEVHQKITALKDHCEANGIRLPLIISDGEKGSENFRGTGWRDIEKTLVYAEGRIQSIVIPDKDMLTRDVGLYLLKEKELRDSFGVSIEVADGRNRKLDQSRDLSLN
jgi:hypothetical protein